MMPPLWWPLHPCPGCHVPNGRLSSFCLLAVKRHAGCSATLPNRRFVSGALLERERRSTTGQPHRSSSRSVLCRGTAGCARIWGSFGVLRLGKRLVVDAPASADRPLHRTGRFGYSTEYCLLLGPPSERANDGCCCACLSALSCHPGVDHILHHSRPQGLSASAIPSPQMRCLTLRIGVSPAPLSECCAATRPR